MIDIFVIKQQVLNKTTFLLCFVLASFFHSTLVFAQVFEEPVGIYSTTKPQTQNRDAKIYDWATRHRYILASNKLKKPKIIFLGNSITHYWGGLPNGPINSASDVKNPFFDSLHAANLGYGWDRIENVLWRIYHGELDGYQAEKAVILIGTNNLDVNSDNEIIGGLQFLIQAIEVRQPACKILLLGLLPRRDYEMRIIKLNQDILQLTKTLGIEYANPGKIFLNEDGKIDELLFSDGLHPTAEGYRELENYLRPYLKK